MTDFLGWPILHLISIANFLILLWNVKELIQIKRDVSYLQGQFHQLEVKQHE